MTPHVGICIPSNGTWQSAFGKSLVMLMARAMTQGINGQGQQKVSVLTSEGSVLPQLRHTLVANALRNDCSHILFLDSDMTFPSDTLHRLAGHNKPIVAANCTTRTEPVTPVAIGMDNKRVMSVGRDDLEQVRQVGTAVMLIEASVFKKMQPPFFAHEWTEELKAYSGEDIFFVYKAKAELGINVFVDHGLSQEIKHIGSRHYGHGDINPDHERVTRDNNPVDVYNHCLVDKEEVENG